MLHFQRIDVYKTSESIDDKATDEKTRQLMLIRQANQKSVIFVTIGIF